LSEYVSFSMLGSYGRLCNQMFQVAAVSCLAKDRNLQLILPDESRAEIRNHFKIPAVDLNEQTAQFIKYRWNEPGFSHSREMALIPGNCDVVGYLQSWKYITDPEHVRKIFQFEETLRNATKDKLPVGKQRVAIHVRRGDYVKLRDTHPPLSVDYYRAAIDILRKRLGSVDFIAFSDDREWCRQNIAEATVYEGLSNIEDLCAMSSCEHHIIANSSFSWWGSWLASSSEQVVIAPKNWFGPSGPKDTQDLLPEHYEVIDV